MKIMKRPLKILLVVMCAFVGVAAVNTDHGKYFEISKNIEIFTNLYKEINTYYVDDIDPAKLMRTGVDAMLESLDPYTNYISESEIEGFRYMTEGKYNGIGAQIRKTGDYVTITEPYENCPAQKAGLKAGDVLLEIDGKSAKNKSTDDISNILKGFPGTEVILTIKRPGKDKNQKITMVRDEVRVPNVPYSGIISDGVGYVALTTFTRDAGKNVGDAVKKLKEENPNLKGVIFDLRGNGGGLLTEAVNVCNVFVPKGELVVTTKGKVTDWDRSFKTLNKSIDEEVPLVVLIDKGSASASGKGLVQNTRDVGYNSRVKLTTAKYYIPSGRCIQGVNYEDGEPIDIADAKRTQFKTRNGRVVLDGGGVKPDVLLGKNDNKNILRSLRRQNMIFDYVTKYCLDHETLTSVDDFNFTRFNDFTTFINEKGFKYDTQSEKILEQLQSLAKEEGYIGSIEKEIADIQNKIQADKKNDLEKYKEAIIDRIEKEVVSRYFYQKGKIEMGLRNDQEIKDAIVLFNDNSKYQALLK